MTIPRWRKSSRSHQNGACVELSNTLDEIRDSKNPTGPTLRADAAALVTAIKAGRFDR
ncbi:DUF397 domain-containing protein [Gandjariella thermophila]|uniref:DUF397 domain-containing protein n=1 Tax=Gandjariella thermophila TaxID=1931992 RepID=A0A4D4JED4_9PSEU|nr:DUF397 domain-containing protein [Gandjariella thermophila]GDY34014.1 hypothetical protein GTS_56470 [Gandjariella thermophila]